MIFRLPVGSFFRCRVSVVRGLVAVRRGLGVGPEREQLALDQRPLLDLRPTVLGRDHLSKAAKAEFPTQCVELVHIGRLQPPVFPIELERHMIVQHHQLAAELDRLSGRPEIFLSLLAGNLVDTCQHVVERAELLQ